MNVTDRLKIWAKRVRRDGITLWFASKHPRTPWYAKAVGLFVVAYALSPIDLIPDFIPVLGYVDDVLLLPAFIWLSIKLLPADVLLECRSQAEEWMMSRKSKPRNWAGAALILIIWLVVGVAAWQLFFSDTETVTISTDRHSHYFSSGKSTTVSFARLNTFVNVMTAMANAISTTASSGYPAARKAVSCSASRVPRPS